MKAIFTVFFSIIVFASFSGDLNKSVLKCCNRPDLSSTPDTIIVVIDVWTEIQSIKSCINVLEITLDLQSQSKIANKIFVEKKLDSKAIAEFQKNYPANGLLILSKLKMKKKAYDVPGNEIEYFDNGKPGPFFEIIGERIKPWTNLFAEITSKWKYYDLKSGKQYAFKIKNKKVFELRKYVSDIESFVGANQTVLEPLFYQNGKMVAEELLKTKD